MNPLAMEACICLRSWTRGYCTLPVKMLAIKFSSFIKYLIELPRGRLAPLDRKQFRLVSNPGPLKLTQGFQNEEVLVAETCEKVM
ncbi:hypothetical protein OUZ56_011600 [Daphnia magna]|uniref:Uncharacterized protein n=1 Tax=Daphnia magna TaxID=35525 RepID=A0ABQ9Z0M4_9CRUS|nr:hypothetical protein OUZ56_011600 [Daphnia magna]